jgi:hypothetical protein
MKEHISQLEFLRSGKELSQDGMYFELKAFQYLIFHEFREIYDASGEYSRLAKYLHGRGVGNMDAAMAEMLLQPVRNALSDLLSATSTKIFEQHPQTSREPSSKKRKPAEIAVLFRQVLHELSGVLQISIDEQSAIDELENDLEAVLGIYLFERATKEHKIIPIEPGKLFFILVYRRLWMSLQTSPVKSILTVERTMSLLWQSTEHHEMQIPDLLLGERFSLTRYSPVTFKSVVINTILNSAGTPKIKEFLRVHEYQNILYFNKERFEKVLEWIGLFSLISIKNDKKVSGEDFSSYYQVALDVINQAKTSAAEVHYELLQLQKRLRAVAE